MPIDISIHPVRELAYCRVAGGIDAQECIDSLAAYVAHPQFDPRFNFLTVTKGVQHVDGTFRSIVMAVQRSMPLIRHFTQDSLWVIHAPNDVTFGMARIVQQVVEPFSRAQLEVLRDPSEALSCAGQPETRFCQIETALGLHPETD